MSFLFGKIAWWLIRPGNFLLLLLALGLLLRGLGHRATGRLCTTVAIVSFFAIAVLPIGPWFLSPLEARFPQPTLPQSVDGIIVLGGAIDPVRSEDRQQLVTNGSVERLLAFADLARRYPNAKLIFTGGTGSVVDSKSREADWLIRLLPILGPAESRVMLERELRNTFENAAYSKALAKPAPGEAWVLITSAVHMPRSVGVFRAQAWPVIAYPVDYQTLARPIAGGFEFDFLHGLSAMDAVAYEWIGLIYYYARGWSDALYPKP